MSAIFHSGELSAQRLAGTRGVADELGAMLGTALPAGNRLDSLLSNLHMLAVSSVTPSTATDPHMVWVSVLFGRQFAKGPTPQQLTVDSRAVPPNDVLRDNLAAAPNSSVGVLALDFMNRRRYRTNGSVAQWPRMKGVDDQSVVSVNVREAFPNCPKYIQMRDLRPETAELPPLVADAATEQDVALSEADRALIAVSDTFFLGTYYEETGADVNHRGGLPGFVRVVSDTELFWPDYRGNGMFQSFGNLQVDDRAGLAFVDFDTGGLLQLSGRATVEWTVSKDLGVEPAAERIVRFQVDRVRRSVGPVTNFRWETVQYSPYNPVIPDSAEATLSLTSEFPMEVELVKITEETPNVKTFRFLAPRYVKFLPGQYATFDFGEMPEAGGETSHVVRTWTLSEAANSTKGDVTLEISVKRKPGGFTSNWLHDNAKLGHRVKLLGVDGDMTPFRDPELPKKLLLISGGIGMTPNMAILRGIGARSKGLEDESPDIVFIHQERYQDYVPFKKELLRRAKVSNGRTRLFFLISGQEAVNESEGQTEKHVEMRPGRINKGFLRDHVADILERMIYLCGPTSFMESISSSLLHLGASQDQIVTEQFNF